MENFCRISDAKILNLPFKSSTFYKWHRNGQYPQIFVKVGHSVFINLKELQNLFNVKESQNKQENVSPSVQGFGQDKKSKKISDMSQNMANSHKETAGNFTKDKWLDASVERRTQYRSEWNHSPLGLERLKIVDRWESEG